MAVTVDGNSNIVEYSVSEDATPVNPGDSSSGYGQLSYTILDNPNAVRTLDQPTKLVDTQIGSFDGVVASVSGTDGVLNVTANSALARMSKWRTVIPFSGTLKDYCNRMRDIVSLDRNIVADSTISGVTVYAPGYVGNVWEGFKRFLSANQLEIVQENVNFRVRPMRSKVAEPFGVSTLTRNAEVAHTSELVRVHWYETAGWKSNTKIFPVPSDDILEPISVGANEIVEQEVTIDGSITSLKQPTAVDYVEKNPSLSGTTGVYCVSGSDGKPITATRWKASGGWLRVETTPDPSVIKIIVRGGKVEDYAPYRIGATAGSSNFYNSLHILGTGFTWRKRTFEMKTGATPSDSEAESVVDVDNKNIMTADSAYRAALIASRETSGSRVSISGTALKLDDEGFSNPLGALIHDVDGVLRVSSQNVSSGSVGFVANGDTTISDLENHLGAMSIAQFNSRYNGLRIADFNAQPYRKG